MAAMASYATSARPETRVVHYEPIARVDASRVRSDLDRQLRALRRAGYRLVRREPLGPRSVRIREQVPIGECIAALAGAQGRWRVADLIWVPRDGSRPLIHRERTEPYRRTALTRVCPIRPDPDLSDRARVAIDVDLRHAGDGGAEVLVLRGPPARVGADGPAIAGDRVVHVTVDRLPATLNAISVLFILLVIGMMVEATVHGRWERGERERTLRRFIIAFPAGLRGELEELVRSAGSPSGARALRDRLSALSPLAYAATFSRWRADQDWIDARHAALLRELRARRANGKHATYRGGGEGLIVLTLVVRHRCELPELAAPLDTLNLAVALDSSLPRHDRELVSVDVLFHPAERTEALDPVELAACFPELVALDASNQPCLGCEAPLALGAVRCPSCGTTNPPAPS